MLRTCHRISCKLKQMSWAQNHQHKWSIESNSMMCCKPYNLGSTWTPFHHRSCVLIHFTVHDLTIFIVGLSDHWSRYQVHNTFHSSEETFVDRLHLKHIVCKLLSLHMFGIESRNHWQNFDYHGHDYCYCGFGFNYYHLKEISYCLWLNFEWIWLHFRHFFVGFPKLKLINLSFRP